MGRKTEEGFALVIILIVVAVAFWVYLIHDITTAIRNIGGTP